MKKMCDRKKAIGLGWAGLGWAGLGLGAGGLGGWGAGAGAGLRLVGLKRKLV